MAALYAEAVELINSAKLSQDKDEQVRKIAQIEEVGGLRAHGNRNLTKPAC
jgi:hypothetical protein